jgi:DNA-binding response OmpR family regulator
MEYGSLFPRSFRKSSAKLSHGSQNIYHIHMAPAKVLLIESDRTTVPSYSSALLKRGFALFVENSPRKAADRARATKPDVIVLDAISLRTSGIRLCRRLHKDVDDCPIVLITKAILSDPESVGAQAILVPPFTPRKLLNAVHRQLPSDAASCIQAGPIRINTKQHKVSCGGREDQVTPKEARLLEVFLRHPGVLLTRKFLIKTVWDTDYTGDTRTLDVHISWLRQILEPDPSSPRYLKTVRGQGYRLDIPETSKK